MTYMVFASFEPRLLLTLFDLIKILNFFFRKGSRKTNDYPLLQCWKIAYFKALLISFNIFQPCPNGALV